MRYVFICPELSGNGGTETVLTKVINHVSEKADVSLLLTTKPDNEYWLNTFADKVDIEINNFTESVGKLWFLFTKLFSVKNDTKVIVLGANLIKYTAIFRKLFARKWTIISWIHYSLINQDMFDPQNITYADKHWAISSPIKEQLIDLGIKEDDIDLIYNPVKISDDHLNHADEQDYQIVYVGKVMRDGQKNLQELVEGVKAYPDPLTVHLIGAEDEGDPIRPMIDVYGLKDQFTFHGWLRDPWAEVLSIKPKALILTSKYEGLPMVMIEAMSYGIPCLVANFSGYEDVMIPSVNGYVYRQGDIDDLSDKLGKMKEANFDPVIIHDSVNKFSEETYFEGLDQAL